MKNVFYFSACLFLLSSCGSGTGEELAGQGDSAGPSERIADSVPHEVMSGKGGTWAYRPDSCFNELVLGSTKSFAEFWRKNGANMKTLNGKRKIMSYFNTQKTEWMAVYMTTDSKSQELAYGVVVQKAGTPGSPPMPCADQPEYLSKANVITGHGIYIGMSPSYVQGIYTDQPMMEWQKGDTLYLSYGAKEKDAENFPYYSWNSFTAVYKFVDDKLRRIEYFVDPAELEKR